jgi:putative transposase
MPSRNSIKIYVENGYYHIYNRGVEKRIIFEDDQDYKVFLKYIREILSPVDIGQSSDTEKILLKNYSTEIDLVAYCLMPNHFHFLIKQKSKFSIEGFMRALMTRYSMYFNKRYDRVGSLFQGRYKAVLIKDEPYLLHLSRYIHLNPAEYTNNLESAYSSYADYLGRRNTPWVKPNDILSLFAQNSVVNLQKIKSYKKFVEEYATDSSIILGGLVLE